jgi:glycosyltransferase involved in cell wall biosynthesis
MNPLISVIIPAHHNERTIAIAIQSILDQTYANLEIIVVDDNSTDDTYQVVKQFNSVRYFVLLFDDPHRFNHRGVNINAGWIARNYGVDHAKGEWITFQDADDASLLNRIEVQYHLAKKYHSNHICIGWQKFDESLIGTSLDADCYLEKHPQMIINSKQILELAKKTKGIGFSILGELHQYVPFPLKRRLPIFFRAWDSYPFAGNCPLVLRDVFDRVRFRPRNERVWPSNRGRGADRDFNFHTAEIFQNSICVNIPLYLWRIS